MAGGYTIGIASDTKAFKQGVETGLIKPTEDAKQALDDLGKSRGPGELEGDLKAAGRAGQGAGDDIERAMRDAQHATERLRDETKDTARRIEQEYRDSYRSAGRSADTFQHDAGENVQGFKDEAISNLSEVASSFTGDLTQMSDGVQGLAGGLAGSLTPGIGIPVAILGAAAGAFLAAWQQSTEQIKQISADTFDQIASDGMASFDSLEAYSSRLKDAYADHDDEIKKIADTLGILPETAAAAWAGQADAIGIVKKATEEWRDKNAEAFKAGDGLASDAARDFGHLYDALQDTWTGYDVGKEKAGRYLSGLSDDLLTAVSKTKDAEVEVDKLGNKIVHLPDGDVYIDAKTGQASRDVSKFRGDVDGVINHLNGRDVVLDVHGNARPFLETVRRMQNTAFKPIKINVDASVTYRDKGGKFIQ